MITREEVKYNLHIEMLKQSFQRQGDGMTSILLGNATSTAFNFFEKHIDKLERHIKSLEAQLGNTEQLTCDKCKHVCYFSPHDSLECGNKDGSFYGMDVDFTDGCLKFEPKDTQ